MQPIPYFPWGILWPHRVYLWSQLGTPQGNFYLADLLPEMKTDMGKNT